MVKLADEDTKDAASVPEAVYVARMKADRCRFSAGYLNADSATTILQEDMNNTMSGDTSSDPCLKIWHMHDLFSRVGNGKYGVFPFFEIDKLIERGLQFNSDLQYSNDFVAISRYGGAHWEADWLNNNDTFAWHVNCDPKQKERAVQIAEVMTMDKIQELSDKGINVFKTIKTDANNS